MCESGSVKTHYPGTKTSITVGIHSNKYHNINSHKRPKSNLSYFEIKSRTNHYNNDNLLFLGLKSILFYVRIGTNKKSRCSKPEIEQQDQNMLPSRIGHMIMIKRSVSLHKTVWNMTK